MTDENLGWIAGKDTDDLLASMMSPDPGSRVHEQLKTAIQVRIAEIQRDTARDSLRWAKLSAISTVLATAVAVIALLAALFG